MLDIVQNHLLQYFRKENKCKLLLACSGGVDSMVLADLMHKSSVVFEIAHCNFALREEDSDADEAFVAQYSKEKGIPFHTQKFDTKNHANTQGVSIQMAARELRYTWFEALKITHEFDGVLTAHHLDDQLETFLINFGRGSGLKGLRGIASDHIIRPLIDISKADIVRYAKDHKLVWREDVSNAKDDYLRNALRHHVIPAWKKMRPNLLQQTQKSLQNLALAQEALDEHLKNFKKQHFKSFSDGIAIEVEPLLALHPLAYYLHALFSPYGFNEVEDLIQLLQTQSGKVLHSQTYRLIRDRDSVLLSAPKANTPQELYWAPDDVLTVPLKLKSVSHTEADKNSAILAPHLLKFPLILRKYREGDYFYPAGMKGKKKLSKFFKDEKYSLLEKENQWLLCSEDQIVWVIGRRVDARFASSSATNKPLMIRCD